MRRQTNSLTPRQAWMRVSQMTRARTRAPERSRAQRKRASRRTSPRHAKPDNDTTDDGDNDTGNESTGAAA
jgi:hypothetical protein